MSARSKARKRALDVLFECEARGLPLGSTVDDRRRAAATDPRVPPMPEYSLVLIDGVAAEQQRIDALLSTYSQGWPLDRMPAVDRTILRLATYEILSRDEVPDAVAVSEAVRLAQELSTAESPTFINGLLARIVATKASSNAEPGGAA